MNPLEEIGPVRVSVTLDADDAQLLREIMEGEWHFRKPGDAAAWMLRVHLEQARREGGASSYVSNRNDEAKLRFAERAAAAPVLPALPARVIDLATWKNGAGKPGQA